MHDTIEPAFAAWESFYVIVGSSGAALTGLQFVVIALIADSRRANSLSEIDAFGTPTVVHFCAVLLVSALLSAPWHGLSGASVALGTTGLAGLIYAILVLRRARRATSYKPVLEDWIWHVALPLIAHGTLLGAAIVLARYAEGALFAVAASVLVLLFTGIHNAWDTVTYIAVTLLNPSPGNGAGAAAGEASAAASQGTTATTATTAPDAPLTPAAEPRA